MHWATEEDGKLNKKGDQRALGIQCTPYCNIYFPVRGLHALKASRLPLTSH